MNSEPASTFSDPAQAVVSGQPKPPEKYKSGRMMVGIAVLALAGVLGSMLVWQRLNAIQEQLARQSADAGSDATQARGTAKQAQDLALETAAKLAVIEAKLAEVSLQRTQLEELMQSLARSRDENLMVDIESSLRLAQQQAQLTGSLEPLLAALKTAELRVNRAAQPRLAHVQRAIARDAGRVKATALADLPALLVKLDELVSLADELPVANAVSLPKPVDSAKRKVDETLGTWWARLGAVVRDEVNSLVRVGRIEEPDAALLTPEQSFFLRENLKLKLLNARLGLLSRQNEAARADLASAAVSISKFFDATSRKTQAANALLSQVQPQMRLLEIPRIDETMTALATAAAGR
jgi:uroporphyrin-3 C-methyltransferase